MREINGTPTEPCWNPIWNPCARYLCRMEPLEPFIYKVSYIEKEKKKIYRSQPTRNF